MLRIINGHNYLSSNFELWYSLLDIIGSYLLTGKVPKIIEAVKFIPMGVQKSLRKTRILGIDIDPLKDNVVQILVEERQRIKQELKNTEGSDPEYQHLSSRAQAMKILVNALSYGIFIELNPKDKKSEFQVNGLDNFVTKENRFDGDVGVLERKRIHADGIVYIGKEANNIEDQPLDVTGAQVFINEGEIKQKILALTPREARKCEVDRSNLNKIKNRVKNGKLSSLETPAVKRLVDYIVTGYSQAL